MMEIDKEKEKEKVENKETQKSNDQQNTENQENQEQVNSNGKIQVRIGKIGDFVLAGFVILIIGTAVLTYYLIHLTKESYDKQYYDLISSLPVETNTTVDENKENEEDIGSVANIIGSALSDVTGQSSSQTTTDDNSKNVLNESLVVLYNGLLLDTSKMDEVTPKYIDSRQSENEKYIITYYSYENYTFKDAKLGTFSSQLYEGLVKIDNVGKIAISEDYNAIPRNVKVINSIPEIISNNVSAKNYDTVKTIIADLDGNLTEEYVLVLANKKTGYSSIALFDSKGSKVADLASIEKSKWKNDTNNEYYLNINNVDLIDIDNDGIMEIVLEIPHATGNSTVSLLKYNNGELQGKTGIECSLLSE